MWYTISVIGRQHTRAPIRKKDENMRNDLYSFVNELNNMFYDGGFRSFPIDVEKTENGYMILCELPGIKKEDISITFDEGELLIEASPKKNNKENKYVIHERSSQKLKRTISLGDDIDENKFQAKLEDGILYVNVFNKEKQEKKAKNIVIE